MMVRTVAEVAVTSWTDSDRRCGDVDDEDDDDEEELELPEEDEDEEEEVELVLSVDPVLDALRRTKVDDVDGSVLLDDNGSERGESVFATIAAADVEAVGAVRRDGEVGGRIALATITPFSATTS